MTVRVSTPTSWSCDLNEWDAFSLEAALQLRESTEDGEVVVVTVGDEEAEEALLGCLARGADRAVRVWDDSLQGADPLAVARVCRRGRARGAGPGPVRGPVLGRGQRGDRRGAGRLPRDAPRRRRQELDYDAGSATATVKRELEGGLVEVLRVRTPALLTIQTGINEPRYANLRAIKQAREKPLDVIRLTSSGVEPARSRRRRARGGGA